MLIHFIQLIRSSKKTYFNLISLLITSHLCSTKRLNVFCILVGNIFDRTIEENDLPHIVVFPLSHIYRHLHKIYKEGINTNPNHNGLNNNKDQALNMAGYNRICWVYAEHIRFA